MISFSNGIFPLYNFLAQLSLYLCSYLDLIVNLEIIIGDASEVSESRDMQSTLHINKDMMPRSLSNMNSAL